MENSDASPLPPSIHLTSTTTSSRSSSRSPARNPTPPYQTADPLLSNLSPESTLEALTSTDVVAPKEKDSHDVLSKTISNTSPAERALGIRAAVAAQRLGQWYKEIQSWEWPDQAGSQAGKGFVPPYKKMAAESASESSGVEYYGSLPGQTVKQYGKRIEEIRDGMEDLHVDELKGHVLSAHIPSWSRPSSSHSTASTPPSLSYVQLSDFTAVITATILRALPLLSRLNSLLTAWDVRLAVLRRIPGLLRRLRFARIELNSSSASLKSSHHPGEDDVLYSSINFRAKKAELEAVVVAAGQRMDWIIDRLDGREDSLPEKWIDLLETIESDFSAWVVEAQKRAAQNEWQREAQQTPKHNFTEAFDEISAPMTTIDEESKQPANESAMENTEENLSSLLEQSLESLEESPGNELTAPITTINEEPKKPASQSAMEDTEENVSPLLKQPLGSLEESDKFTTAIETIGEESKAPANESTIEDTGKDIQQRSKQLLESPIKLPKTRQGHVNPEKPTENPPRRTSNASANSTLSEFPSLVSSADARETQPASSDGTPLFLKTPPQFRSDYPLSSNTHGNHTLREDQLLGLTDPEDFPRTSPGHNRAVSLPLQRFINERLDMECENKPAVGDDSERRPSTASAANLPEQQGGNPIPDRKENSIPTTNVPRPENKHLKTFGNGKARAQVTTTRAPKTMNHNKDAYSRSSDRHAQHPRATNNRNPARFRKKPTVHSGTDNQQKSNTQMGDSSAGSGPEKTGSRSSTPPKLQRKRRDTLDKKIDSILSTLPGSIHLVSSADQNPASSQALSRPLNARERFDSVSPEGTPPPVNTPPAITLTPAPPRRRRSPPRAPEESSVKVYHLYRGGKSVPSKLFVRTVGEDGGRVMVRVGGGWADLGEYLREFAIHHGRRSITETPRVEVQGILPHNSPTYPSPSERNAAHRRRSIVSSRPATSIAVRKKRRDSNVSDMAEFKSSSGGPISTSFSTLSNTSQRRQSASSITSTGAVSTSSEAFHKSFTPSASTPSMSSSTPLGLAGPKPRSRQISISPQREAWVEDVLGQARRSSSLNPHKLGISEKSVPRPHTLSKAKSIGDIASVGRSKRVALRGLSGKH